MSATRKIRETLGFSQQELADYLGVSRSRISMAEGRRRELPTAALLKIGALEKIIQNNLPCKGTHLQKQFDKDAGVMRRFAQQCSHEAEAAKKILRRMQQDYGRCLQALAAIEQLQNMLPQEKTNKKDQLCLELQQLKTLKKLSACAPARQMKLTLTIQALQLQAAKAESAKF